MASFFGEIIQQPSRAFWDGFEEVEDNEESMVEKKPVFTLFNVKEGDTEIEAYDIMIFATDDISSRFTTASLISTTSKHIATVEESIENNDNLKKKRVTAELFKVDDKILLLKCVSVVDICYANELLSCITPWLNCSKEVIILASKSVNEYKSLNHSSVLENSFLRCLKTKSFKNSTFCPSLECPNSLTGFPAAVASWCQVKDQPCIVYLYYYIIHSVSITSSINVEPLTKLFQKFQWYQQFQRIHKIGDIKSVDLHNQFRHIIENSNLYM
ncbi:proteasome assembly chaperone 1 [Lycorma delicatula]|uniref:proteasome assembly chaperone 1 n=1 Tax=Lycorma delicatula TaxID=130591 RepID=UPI003F50D681